MTIITKSDLRITRPIESIVSIFTSDSLGLCVEYEDYTGKHTIVGVKRIVK